MNVLNVNVRPAYEIKNPTIIIDGESVSLTKNKNGGYSCRYETEKDAVELCVCKFNEINGKFWFLYSLLFFFISVLGIFDARYDKRCYCLRYKTVLQLNGENTVNIAFNPFKEGGKAVQCTADGSTEESENEYFTDKTAKKRLKTMKIVKLLIWLAAIIIAVAVTIIKIIG